MMAAATTLDLRWFLLLLFNWVSEAYRMSSFKTKYIEWKLLFFHDVHHNIREQQQQQQQQQKQQKMKFHNTFVLCKCA